MVILPAVARELSASEEPSPGRTAGSVGPGIPDAGGPAIGAGLTEPVLIEESKYPRRAPTTSAPAAAAEAIMKGIEGER